MLCPQCRLPAKQTEFHEVVESACPACGGIWISNRALRRLLDKPAAATDAADEQGIADLSQQVSATNLTIELTCPDCHVPMNKDQFHPMISVQVDRCPKCDYLWLDAGEQGLLIRLYQEMLDTDDPEIAQKRDRLIKLDAMCRERTPEPTKFDGELLGFQKPLTWPRHHRRDPLVAVVGKVVDAVWSLLSPK